jgi:GAF domain-containing protein
MTNKEKKNLFAALLKKIEGILAEPRQRDDTLRVICRLLKENVSYYDWVGFYLAEQPRRQLCLGPFVGEPTEHTKIGFGKGICGQAAERRETYVIQDVSKESNYLPCSPKVKSEIVVPIFSKGAIVGEIDIDSYALAPFSKEDKVFLEALSGLLGELF